jgi:DNA-binding Lrp family transcriptional regulator
MQESCNSCLVIDQKPATTHLDDLDRRIVAALQTDPRASWAQLGGAVGVSETTVLRRVQRLRETGSLVIVAAPDPLLCGFGQPILLQFRTVPGDASTLAHELAQRSDTRFVAMLTGRSDVMCELIAPDRQYLSRVLMEELPHPGSILATTSEIVLKTFKTSDQWSRALLDVDAPETADEQRSAPADKKVKLDDMDLQLLAALGGDGRRSYADLSSALGLSETAIARRVSGLTSSNRLYFLAMVDPAALGFGLEVLIHLRVELASLESVAVALAGTTEVRYVSATTGYSDLACEAIFRDTDALYQFLTSSVAALPGIREVEVDVMLETVKRGYRYPLFTKEESPIKLPSPSSSMTRVSGPRSEAPKRKALSKAKNTAAVGS